MLNDATNEAEMMEFREGLKTWITENTDWKLYSGDTLPGKNSSVGFLHEIKEGKRGPVRSAWVHVDLFPTWVNDGDRMVLHEGRGGFVPLPNELFNANRDITDRGFEVPDSGEERRLDGVGLRRLAYPIPRVHAGVPLSGAGPQDGRSQGFSRPDLGLPERGLFVVGAAWRNQGDPGVSGGCLDDLAIAKHQRSAGTHSYTFVEVFAPLVGPQRGAVGEQVVGCRATSVAPVAAPQFVAAVDDLGVVDEDFVDAVGAREGEQWGVERTHDGDVGGAPGAHGTDAGLAGPAMDALVDGTNGAARRGRGRRSVGCNGDRRRHNGVVAIGCVAAVGCGCVTVVGGGAADVQLKIVGSVNGVVFTVGCITIESQHDLIVGATVVLGVAVVGRFLGGFGLWFGLGRVGSRSVFGNANFDGVRLAATAGAGQQAERHQGDQECSAESVRLHAGSIGTGVGKTSLRPKLETQVLLVERA
ncbi:hypothetical protein GQR58_030120 [Nymphon striatum]|nr:hypothetical protein GQR58_030120 [Nymphon striatum]